MRSSELHVMACHLRDQVQRLRVCSSHQQGAPDHPSRLPLADIRRRIARQAREVEAWATQLKDPCALAAAKEAYLALQKLSSSPHGQSPHWSKIGAVVLVRVEHDCAVDSNELVGRLIPATLDMVLSEPPCSPLKASVGLLSIGDQALIKWAGEASSAGDSVTTMAPLLVSILFPQSAPGGSTTMMEHLYLAVDEGRYCPSFLRSAAVTAVIIPVLQGHLAVMERRCIGPCLCAGYPRS